MIAQWILSFALSGGLVAWWTSSALPLRDDCFCQGPVLDSGNGHLSPPAIDTTGSGCVTTNTESESPPPCDGCTVTWEIEVTWMHNGDGKVDGLNGPSYFYGVTSGSSVTFGSSKYLDCGGSTTFRADNLTQGSWRSARFNCTACQ